MIDTSKNGALFNFYAEFWKLNREIFATNPSIEKEEMLFDNRQRLLSKYNDPNCNNYMRSLCRALIEMYVTSPSAVLTFPVDKGTPHYRFMAQFWILQKKYINGGPDIPPIFSDMYWNQLIEEVKNLTREFNNEVWSKYANDLCITFLNFQEKRQQTEKTA